MFSKKLIYAIKIVEILEKKESVKGAVITKALEVSAPYFEQIVKTLVDSGCVIATRGCNGGYSINRDKHECRTISLADIIFAFHPNIMKEEGAIASAIEGMINGALTETWG